MRTPLLVGIIVSVHCVAVGSAVLIQGCRSTMQPAKVTADKPVVAETKEVKAPAPMPQPVAPVAEKAKVEPAAPVETTEYVVGNGESLSTISYKYGLKMPEVMALNGITNPNKLRVGQKLMLPGKVNISSPKRIVPKKAKVSEEAPKEEETGDSAAEGAGEYTVAKGDVLSRIAAKHGTTVSAIKKANALTSDKVMVGQKLMVPGAAPKAATAPAEAVSTEEKTDADTAAQPESADKTPEKTPTPVGDTGISAPVSTPVRSASAQTYTVEPNDDIVKIAKMWGVKADDIKKANNITDDAPLKPGKVLTIPISAE